MYIANLRDNVGSPTEKEENAEQAQCHDEEYERDKIATALHIRRSEQIHDISQQEGLARVHARCTILASIGYFALGSFLTSDNTSY